MGKRSSKAPDFFLFGCERGGTTMLASLLSAHPDVFAVNDSFVYRRFAAVFRAQQGGGTGMSERLKQIVRTGLAQRSYFVYKQAMKLRARLRKQRPDSYLHELDGLPMADFPIAPELAGAFVDDLLAHYRQPLPGQKHATWLAEYAEHFDSTALLDAARAGALTLRAMLDEAFAQVVQPAQRDKRLLGEKTPVHLYYAPWLRQVYPEAKMISLLRSPLSNIASIYKRMDRNLQAAVDLYKSVYDTRFAFLYEDADKLTVKYEDLIREPEATLARIYAYLGLSDTEEIRVAMPQDYIKKKYTGGDIDPERDRKSREVLSAEQQAYVLGECAEILAKYYPEEQPA